MFLERFGVKGLKDDISLFEKQAKDGKDPDLEAVAEQTLPTSKKHLTVAQDLPTQDDRAQAGETANKGPVNPPPASIAITSHFSGWQFARLTADPSDGIDGEALRKHFGDTLEAFASFKAGMTCFEPRGES